MSFKLNLLCLSCCYDWGGGVGLLKYLERESCHLDENRIFHVKSELFVFISSVAKMRT